jgi:MoxR-like ATPase
MQKLVPTVYIDDSIKQYIVNIVTATRNPGAIIPPEIARYIQYGASPRASIAFQQVAKALALIDGRDYVIPEDVKQLRYSVLRHRIILNFEAIADQVHPEVIIDAIFNATTAP